MPVSAEKEKALAARMQELGVSENDFEESFVRSSGPGGQKVNKTSSCVHLRPHPHRSFRKMPAGKISNIKPSSGTPTPVGQN